TTDYFILSGHRRFGGAQLAVKLTGFPREVPCRFVDIEHRDPKALRLLREFNRQRVKTAEELIREELIAGNPDDAEVILEHRRKRAEVKVGPNIHLGKEKLRKRFTEAKMPLLNATVEVVFKYRKNWPLSDRGIH